jgi:hypothetical protein
MTPLRKLLTRLDPDKKMTQELAAAGIDRIYMAGKVAATKTQ